MPLWSLVMPGFECKLKGFPKVNHMPFFKDFAKSTVYGDSHGADAMIPWWGKCPQNKAEKCLSFPLFFQDGFLNPCDRYMSSVGYGFLWNLPSYGSVSITPENITWFSEASQNVDFWVTTIPATTKGMVIDNCLSILVRGAWGVITCELVNSLLITA